MSNSNSNANARGGNNNDLFLAEGLGKVSSNRMTYGSVCCKDAACGLVGNENGVSNTNPVKARSFCSNLARTNSMKYTFCEYNEQVCLGGTDSGMLVPAFGAK